MSRRLMALLAILVSLVMSGCLGRHDLKPTLSPTDRPSSVAAPITHTRLVSGETLTMRNGLTITVPAGWEGTATTDARLRPPGPRGYPSFDEYVLLHRPSGINYPSSVLLYSAEDTRTLFDMLRSSAPALLIKAPGIQMWARGRNLSGEQGTYFMALTSAKHSQFGAVFFGGSGSDPLVSVNGTWKLLDLKGVAAPERGAFVTF